MYQTNQSPEQPAQRLVVAPGGHDIELHYTAIAFSAPEKIGFRYKLDGVDTNWTAAGPRRWVNYQHIPPGEFTFHVQACNADGVWGEHDTVLAISALPFFWERAWFHAVVGLAVCGASAGAFSLILRRRYKQRLARLQT